MEQYTIILKTDNITLSKGIDGFWLYDKSRGMNLAMRGKTEQEAFISALNYYQKRLTKVEIEFKNLENKVNNFINSLE
jgi:hypothetical protein